MRIRSPFLLLLVVALPWLVACRADELAQCGNPMPNGGFYFCAENGSEVCVCATHRCAKRVTEGCESGLRYVYGDEACVSPLDTGNLVEPSEDTEGVCMEANRPLLEAPVDLGMGLGPRTLSFGGDVLVEYVGDPDEPPPTSSTVFFTRRAPAALTAEVAAASFPLPGATAGTRVLPAHSWALCRDSGGQLGALFAHWAVSGPATFHPLLLWIDASGGSSRLVATPFTTEVFGGSGEDVWSFRVVPGPNGCYVAWIRGIPTGGPFAATVAFLGGPGEPVVVPPLAFELPARDGLRGLLGLSGFSPSPAPEDRQELTAISDGIGGVILAAPVVRGDSVRYELIGQRWANGEARWLWSDGGIAVPIIGFDGTEGIAGLEAPYGQAAVVVGTPGASVAVFAVVAVGAEDPWDRCTYYQIVDVADGAAHPRPDPRSMDNGCPSSRMPTLAASMDHSVHLAFTSEWDYRSLDGGGSLRLLIGDNPTTDDTVPLPTGPDTEPALLPRISVEQGEELLVTWFEPDADDALGIRLWRLNGLHDRMPGWPEDGLEVKTTERVLADVTSRGLTSQPPPIWYPGGTGGDGAGAILAWSEIDGSDNPWVFLRRVIYSGP